MDGLLRSGWAGHSAGVCRARDCHGNVRAARLAIRCEKKICLASSLDVALFSAVMLGRSSQADRRIGHGDECRSRLELSAGGLGELAGAARGF